jgi:hypothetical protein
MIMAFAILSLIAPSASYYRVTLSGKLEFSGEFRLYSGAEKYVNVGCISGNFNTMALYKAARRLVGHEVIVSGEAIDWPSGTDLYSISAGKNEIMNFCNGRYIVIFDTITMKK